MDMTMSTYATTSSAVFALSKAVWRVMESLPVLKEDVDILGLTVDELAAEFKSLGLQCESTYAMVEEMLGERHTAHSIYAVDNRLWECLAMQVDEAIRTIQAIEIFITDVRGEETRCLGLRQSDKSKEIERTKARVVQHVDSLYLTMILFNG
jgi:hypothetical protein